MKTKPPSTLRFLRTAGAAFALLCAASGISQAQINTLVSFSFSTTGNPVGTLTLIGSTLYGTTRYPGGMVFSVPVTGGAFTPLAYFGIAGRGSLLEGGLTVSADGSTFYGTTYRGGTSQAGTVFSLPVIGGTPTTLANFSGIYGNGPNAGLTLIGSTLYGTTESGGTSGFGNVFSVPVTGGTPTNLGSFTGAPHGYQPAGDLTLIGSTFYGTTSAGGSGGPGTVFSMPVGGGEPTIIARFGSASGNIPLGSLTRIGSTFYGTASQGGASNKGTVFSVPVTGGTPTALGSFNGANGERPLDSLTLSADGSTFYGTTYAGGSNGLGTVFSLPVTGGTPTALVSFNGANGANPFGSLILSTDGNTLYGTTANGGASNNGTVFSLQVPEPASAMLLLGGGALLALRRRRRPAGA